MGQERRREQVTNCSFPLDECHSFMRRCALRDLIIRIVDTPKSLMWASFILENVTQEKTSDDAHHTDTRNGIFILS